MRTWSRRAGTSRAISSRCGAPSPLSGPTHVAVPFQPFTDLNLTALAWAQGSATSAAHLAASLMQPAMPAWRLNIEVSSLIHR